MVFNYLKSQISRVQMCARIPTIHTLVFCFLIGQPSFSDGLSCPQVNTTSISVPTSVHSLRLGDVNVVAGMGDSLTAANGALSTNVFDVVTQYRGRSFSVGGDFSYSSGVWTLPNILKIFNPNIYGYSVGIGSSASTGSNMNVAVAGAFARNMPSQAAQLVSRLKADGNVNFTGDWKVVTLLVGGNDLCEYCNNMPLHSVSVYKAEVQRALDILHSQLPRTLVNLVEVFDINHVAQLSSSNWFCRLVISNICPCARKSNKATLSSLAAQYQEALKGLVDSGRYDTRSDFTVVLQTFFRNLSLPTTQAAKPDFSYFSPDCFHFSSKGQNIVGKALWNTWLQPISSKQTELRVEDPVACPTTEFIPTRLNERVNPVGATTI